MDKTIESYESKPLHEDYKKVQKQGENNIGALLLAHCIHDE